jgi:hypothetical protein
MFLFATAGPSPTHVPTQRLWAVSRGEKGRNVIILIRIPLVLMFRP